MKKQDLVRIHQVHIGDLSGTALDYRKATKREVQKLILQAVSVRLYKHVQRID
jgi:hypothetical protein